MNCSYHFHLNQIKQDSQSRENWLFINSQTFWHGFLARLYYKHVCHFFNSLLALKLVCVSCSLPRLLPP